MEFKYWKKLYVQSAEWHQFMQIILHCLKHSFCAYFIVYATFIFYIYSFVDNATLVKCQNESGHSEFAWRREHTACLGHFLLTSQLRERLYSHGYITYRLLPSVYQTDFVTVFLLRNEERSKNNFIDLINAHLKKVRS